MVDDNWFLMVSVTWRTGGSTLCYYAQGEGVDKAGRRVKNHGALQSSIVHVTRTVARFK